MKCIKYTIKTMIVLCIYMAQATASIIEIKDQKQFDTILAAKKSIIIDFYAPWCGVCTRAEPDIQTLSQRFTDITFIKVDGDKFKNLKDSYTIFGYPTFVFLDRNAHEIDRVVGRKMKAIENALEKLEKIDTTKSSKKPTAQPEPKKPIAPKKEEPITRDTMPAKTEVAKDNLIELASAADFDALLKEKKQMVLDFYTTWCGPCKMMKPIIAELSKEYPNVLFVKIDAERFPSVAGKYAIRGYPTFIFLDASGKQVSTHTGSSSKMMMKRKIDKITGTQNGTMIIKEYSMPVKKESSSKKKYYHRG